MSKALLIGGETSASLTNSGDSRGQHSEVSSGAPLLPIGDRSSDIPLGDGNCSATKQVESSSSQEVTNETQNNSTAESADGSPTILLVNQKAMRNSRSEAFYVNGRIKGKIQIQLHNGTCHDLTDEECSKTVEDICLKILRKEFPKLGPAAVQLFGLASFDVKRSPKIIWKSPHRRFERSNKNQKYFLRIRYIPYHKYIDNVTKLGEDLLKYLYFQCEDDFVTDRLNEIYCKPVSNSAKARGYAVLSVCIKSKMEDKDPGSILDTYGQKNLLPSREQENLLKKLRLMKYMREKVEEVFKDNDRASLTSFMKLYVCDILKEINCYGVEEYEAKRASNKTEKVHVLVNVHGTIGGLFLSQVFFSSIEDLQGINISDDIQNRSGKIVHLHRAKGCPEVISFDSLEVAESFVSGLNGYARLIKDYYFALCRELEPPQAKRLYESRCHGPIESDTALDKLRRKDLSQEYYILKEDIHRFDVFAVLFNDRGQTRKKQIHKKGKVFFFEDEQDKPFSDINKVIAYMSEVRGLLPKNPIRVRPRTEPVNVLRNLFVEDRILDEDEEELLQAQSRRKKQTVFLQEDIKLKGLFDSGSFSQVHVGEMSDGKRVAVKILPVMENNPGQTYICCEPFNNSIEKMFRLEDPAFFVATYGIQLSFPTRLVMEWAEFGSLSKFFEDRKTDQPIYLNDLMNAALKVSFGLLYMSENNIVHGNICCRNILVHKYAIGKMLVKIGDPGMVDVLNQLPISHKENINRFPWIAPELLNDLKNMTQESDMYAFGTTVWEMFCFGRNPMELIDSSPENFDSPLRAQVLKHKQHENLQVPLTLLARKEDDKKIQRGKTDIITYMKSCWKPAQERSGANQIVRDLNCLMSCYGEVYHLYSVIPDENLDDSVQGIDHTVAAYPKPTRRRRKDPVHLNIQLGPTKPIPTDSPPIFTTVQRPKQQPEKPRVIAEKPPPVDKPTQLVNRPLPDKPDLDLTFLISNHRLEISKTKLGAGHYGEVKKGLLFKSTADRSNPVQIAAKELKGEYQNVIDSPEFKAEAILMSQLSHENIVKFIGISDNMLILEYVENGSLSLYLRNHRKQIKEIDLGVMMTWGPRMMKMTCNVAEGMEYLSGVNVIHCDLAGRNVLLTEDFSAKITDFGLAKILQEDKDYYRRSEEKDLPALWCAPEGLNERKFTTKGDVWSFGILMWEVFTLGKAPLLCQNFSKQGVEKLREGVRLPQPSRCPDQMYNLMKECWQYKPEDRPDFTSIKAKCLDHYASLPVPVTRKIPPPEAPEPPNPAPVAEGPLPSKPPLDRPLPTPIVVPENTLVIDDSEQGILGKGQFGMVKKGTLTMSDGSEKEVAVKIFFENHEGFKEEAEKEIDILKYVEHRNVVKLFTHMHRPEIRIVMEYMKTGTVKRQLDKHRREGKTMSPGLLLRICTDVAAGLDYLSGQKIVHCDLAARNILLTEDYHAKISDFGLSKLIISKDYYRRSKEWMMPLFWCAPEVIQNHILSSKGDVWSFAVLMWECYSGGQIPKLVEHTCKDNNDLCNEQCELLRKGKRLSKPAECHEEIYSLMGKCWKWNKDDRMNFNQIYTCCLKLQEELGMVVTMPLFMD